MPSKCAKLSHPCLIHLTSGLAAAGPLPYTSGAGTLMIKRFSTGWFLLTCSLLGFGGLHAQNPLDELETTYRAAIARAEAPERDLLAKYIEGLRALQERQRAAGDLEGVLAITGEIESAAAEKKRDFEKIPELKRLREIYDTNLARIREQTGRETSRLRDAYRQRLLTETESLTRAGKIEEALLVKARIETLDRESGGPGDMEVLWEWRSRSHVEAVNGCEMETNGDRYDLTGRGGNGWMKSRRDFKPPFRLQIRAMTDSTNIRLYYRSHLAILNWEMNPQELRMHYPGTGASTGIGGKGNVPLNVMSAIEVDVLLDKVVLRVDGETRGEIITTNTGLEGPVGIGPAFGSVVTVESMRVLRLP